MNGNFAYFKAKVAGVFVEQPIALPASIELLGPNGNVICRFTVQENGQFDLQEGKLPEKGRHQVRFTGADGQQVSRVIEFPS